MTKKYDYLIVGSGLFGSVFAREATDKGKRCLVIEERDHIAGNCYTDQKDGINIHVYGAHIFHTDDKRVWDYVNRFSDFRAYKHSPRVSYRDKIYSFPINLLTLHQIWGTRTPQEAIDKIKEKAVPIKNPKNLEEWALSQVGEEIYEIFIKGYTFKQWGRDPKNLPVSIIKRIPIRLTFDDNYFFDRYQGIPIGGYTQMVQNILAGTEVETGTDYFSDVEYFNSLADKIIFTGKIDRFFNYKFGDLEYRSIDFQTERIEILDYQGCPVVNYTDKEVSHTRIVEHKHFEDSNSKVTWITREYPKEYSRGDVPYYPINDEKNSRIYSLYKKEAEKLNNFIFGGRLAEYKYYDMHQVVASALSKSRKELG